MNPSSFDSAAVRRTGPAWAIASATAGLLSITGCGGGNDELAAPLARTAAGESSASPKSVRLEGCVVDEFFIPRTGTTVRLLGADGRLLGHASSDKNGVFSLQVPAQYTVSVSVDKAGGEALVVPTGRTNLSVGACLRDPHA
jgi:hypothetical protein